MAAAVTGLPMLAWLAGCGDTVASHPATSTSSSSTTSTGSTTTSSTSGSPTSSSSGGGIGGMGGTGGAGGGPLLNDTCATAQVVNLDPGGFTTEIGSTAKAASDYATFCADAAGTAPDVVYEIKLSGGGELTLLLDDHLGQNAFDGALSFRKTSCEDRVANDQCVNEAADSEKYHSDLAAGTYWVVVDGNAGSSGDFVLTASLKAPLCGDGIINENSTGEQCDPVPQDDTCYPPGHPKACHFKPPPVLDLEACPGQDVDLALNDQLVIGPNNNTTYADDYIGTCAGANTDGRDHVYHVQPAASGNMTVTVGNDPNNGMPFCNQCVGQVCPAGCWIPIVYVRQGACTGAAQSEMACAFDPTFATTVASVTVPVQQFQDYWIFVDSYWAGEYSAGPYYMELSLSP